MAKGDDAKVTVQTDVGKSLITGRNGCFPITAVTAWRGGSPADVVFIDGIGKRGRAVHGGIILTAEAMDRLATEWVRQRGLAA